MAKLAFPKRFIESVLTSSMFQKVALGLFFFIALTAMIFFSAIPPKYDVRIGEVLQENIIAKKDTINSIETTKLRQAAADAVPKKYTLNQTVTAEVKNQTDNIFNYIKEIRNKDFLTDEEKIKSLREEISTEISDESYNKLVAISDTSLKELETIVKAVIEEVMEEGVKEDSLERTKKYVIDEFKDLKLPAEYKNIGEEIALFTIKPNMIYDREATEEQQREAMEAVAPVKVVANQVLIEKGTVITKEHKEMLKELGLLVGEPWADLSLIAGACIISALLTGMLGYSIYTFHKNVYANNVYLALFVTIILATLVISVGIKPISKYLVPLAAGSMLISILINPNIAILSSFAMSAVCGIMFENDFSFILVALAGALAGVFCSTKVSLRSDLTKAGVIISTINVLSITGLLLLNNSSTFLEVARQSAWGLVNGILSSILAIGMLPFLETAFGITSAIKLLELSNPNQPLLRKLMLDAPGTYHHSVIVGNLAEAGAEAVGADALLARVGADYHDIGKLKRPYFFIENQFMSDNPHDKLTPALSALIITSHVKDGIESADKYHLPSCIKDFIQQHHGTTLLSFFYNKALEENGDNKDKKVDKEIYRYEGPRPQKKEVAIVMLADCVEAAVRSMPNPTPGKIEGLIRQIIKDKLSDGQLDECDLTLKDLDKIAIAFSKVLTGIFHTRIEYPEKLRELQGKDLE